MNKLTLLAAMFAGLRTGFMGAAEALHKVQRPSHATRSRTRSRTRQESNGPKAHRIIKTTGLYGQALMSAFDRKGINWSAKKNKIAAAK